MSLFKVCTWWTAQCSDFEANYDSQLLHSCRFGINDDEKDYVIVASHSGYLSVFQPNALQDEVTFETPGFRPTDQLLEIQLPQPILQLSSGAFVTGSARKSNRQLVVLHPLKLSVYEIHSTSGLTDHGIQYKLNLCFELRFTKSAFSLCHGHFGGYRSSEFFCVTHMDASLTFFEQDGISFQTALGGERNLPSRMVYNSRLDTFVVNSPYYDLECYRYQDVGQSLDVQTPKNIHPIWSVCIGEYALDMQIQQISENESIILVLCENLLYAISDTATTKFIKRLDYAPMCMCSFVAGWYYEPDARLIITIISDNGTLIIYDMATMVWAAQLADVPISMVRSNINSLPGAICTLSEHGKLDISYLGSDPQTFQVPPLNLQKLNFERTQKELIELEEEIKQGIDPETGALSIQCSDDRDLNVHITLEESPQNEEHSSDIPDTFVLPDDAKKLRARAKLLANTTIEQVQVEWLCPSPLKSNKSMHSMQQLNAAQSVDFDVWLYMDNDWDISSLTITVIVSFIAQPNIPRVIEKTETLPLPFFFKLCAPQKNADIRITISVDEITAPAPGQLFMDDFQLDATQNVIAFQSIFTGRIVTIVMAKNSNRYRLQSDHVGAMSSILQSFLQRLETVDGKKGKIKAVPPVPLAAMMTLVDDHFSAYQNVRVIRERLKECSMRLRLFERRYFTKLDDKKTGSIEGILVFLRSTQQAIINEIHALENAKAILSNKQSGLTCGLTIMGQLVRLLDVSKKVSADLGAVLSSTVIDYPDQCWEEMVASGLNYINYVGALRKNKTAKEEDVISIDVTPFDFERFKRHFSGLLDRISHISSDSASNDEGFTRHESLEEVDEEESGVANERRASVDEANSKSKAKKARNESEWVSDVQKMMNILPKLADIHDTETTGTEVPN